MGFGGNTQTSLTTLLAGEDQTNNLIVVENRYNYKNLASLATTVVKSTPGFLRSLTINTYGATCTATLYDNTAASGTKIATVDVAAAGNPTRLYDVQFANGLTVVIAGTTAADITIAYR